MVSRYRLAGHPIDVLGRGVLHRDAVIGGFNYSASVAKTISSAYVVIAAHPLNTAAHYRLFSQYGRAKYIEAGLDVPYISDQEWGTLVLIASALAATLYFVG